MLRIAFKEWAAVCQALESGRQAIILRKGGIAEQGGAFRPEHDRFWLYPTHFHEQQQKGLKASDLFALDAARKHAAPDGILRVSAYCEVVQVWFVNQLEQVLALDPFHVWTEETVRQRFHYRTPGLFVLGVRVGCLDQGIDLPEHPDYAGCKTWVELKEGVPIDRSYFARSELELELLFEEIRTLLFTPKGR